MEIRGSKHRESNEAEAEWAARSVAALPSGKPALRPQEPPRPLPRSSAAAPVSAGRRLPDPARHLFEHAFGYDLRSVRLHDDAISGRVARSIGAAAFARGPQIVTDGPVSQHVLAHEVAHVIQSALEPGAPAIHRYESPEHEDLGDKSLDELEDFVQTEEGKKWAKDHGIDAAKLAAEIKADPLKKAGGKITAGSRSVAGKGKQDVKLSPGEITALHGDFYESPDAIAKAASQPLEKEGGKNEIDKLIEAIDQERKGKLSDPNKTYNEITQGRYLDLAKKNDTHFAPLNRVEWRRLHTQAITEAKAAKDDRGLQHALLVDASGGHFLTDSYASGHLFDKARLMAEITRYLQTNPLRTENPEAQLYAGIVSLSGNAEQLVLKSIHDRMNHEGFDVTNGAGMKWRSFGDAQLAKAPDTSRIAALALFKSRQQIYAAQKGGNPDPKEVEALMPDDATIERATTQAVSYIPAAAADVQGVMYRGRRLASTQFPKPIGALVQSNLETIASPGRQKQLLDLQRASEETGSGPRLAPQFTLGTF
ncbi:MAG TPA: DUF4157 domain-containing protein [Terracidiphilus sp.]|nr:DUF4157 domain-containing protein [Terracidiphilus sp.]